MKKYTCQKNNKNTCHPGGFLDGRRVNESEPSPVSEQIEHTKTECLYAKLCEREGNPRQLVSGSYQLGDSTPSWSDSEHTKSSQERKDGRFRMTTSRHSERSVPCGHPDSYGSPSACLRLKQESTCLENNKIGRHPEFISGSVPFAQSVNEQAQSDDLFEIIQSSHPQAIQILKYSSSTLPCKLHYIQQQEELQVRNDDMLFID